MIGHCAIWGLGFKVHDPPLSWRQLSCVDSFFTYTIVKRSVKDSHNWILADSFVGFIDFPFL